MKWLVYMVGSVVWWQKLIKRDSKAHIFINIVLPNTIEDKYLKNIFERIDRDCRPWNIITVNM